MYSKSLPDDDKLVPVSNPRTWAPYMSTRDCSQGFCSLYCPQWCYIIFPPPPQFDFSADDDSGRNFSPLVIAIIGILASAFLLVSYYAIISKYCGNSRRRENHQEESEFEEDHDPSNHEAWNVTAGGGLDEALIKSITVFKYKKCDGLLTEGTNCSVCLSEFQEDESLRLLPKCSHAFHVMCIDTWLKSHSNCPLCRAHITVSNASPPPLPPPIMEAPQIETTPQIQPERDIEMGIREEETRDEEEKEEDVTNQNHMNQEVRRRSVSMDCVSQGHLSIADILRIDQDEFHDCVTGENCELQRDVGTSKQENNGEEMSRSGIRNNVLVQYCVASPMMMKRSLSSGRFLFTKRGRGQNMANPLSNV
ncbi:putative RING-H2 finger protein ATL29-like [Capsicum annuum]|uniref:RING-H2 finger protein ATL52 n=1 Tax=Capsicum annuum TaxID=4072 RepID=UPI001FB164DA|nr:RING-H2 finger protein ATL52 [Capsicum annuum]KAF3648107.1 putative RING-H2 finger protein ATL29-like [Capsicum annuum]